jgi:outer membrane protein assembly factor BamD
LLRRSGPPPAFASALLAAGFGLALACAKPPPSFEEVAPAEELFAQGQEVLEGERWLGIIPHTDYGEAIEIFQSIIDNYPYSDYAIQAELAIADAYFDDDKYEEALSYYRDFTDLHPQHEKVPYTIYRSALCHERRKRAPNRDQTPTRDALVFLDQLLAEHPHSAYAAQAEPLWRDLRLRLAEQVHGIAEFYMDRDEWESAADRWRMLLNEYPGLGLDAEALYKLAVCYTEMNRDEEADNIFQAIVQNYQDSEWAEDAQQRIAAASE